MPMYVLLVKLTEKGKSDLMNSLRKREQVMEYVKKLGGRNVHVYTTFGRYDVIEIMELPSDEAALKLSIKAAETGDVKIETMRAFTQDELEKIQASL